MKNIAITSLFCSISMILSNVYAQRTAHYEKEVSYLNQYGKTPTDYILGKFSTYDVVLLGEDHAIKEDLDFIIDLIPSLYKAGVYNLGMEFGASEMQSKLDSLLNAKIYDEESARDMMYFYNVGWAYKEYTDIYWSVWKFNKSLPVNAKKFKILNLSYQYNWSAYKSARTLENMSKIFYKGPVDKFRAYLVEKEILEKHEKALLFVGNVHAFTKFKMAILNMNSDNFCDYDDGFLGNRLYKKYPDKIFNILLHCALFNKPDQKTTVVSPAMGAVETIMTMLKNKPLGFDLINTPLQNLPDNSTYSLGYKNLTIGQLFDGYIFLKPFSQMNGCTIDTLFFKNKSWNEIKQQMPDPNWFVAKNMDEYWRRIKEFVDIRLRYKDVIDSTIPRVKSGRIIRYKNFPSNFVQSRNVDIWIPDDYDESKIYSVLYMNDGQMLFDSTTTWNKESWEVADVASKLMKEGKVQRFIVVGVWNIPTLHHSDYFPQKPFESLTPDQKEYVNTQLQKAGITKGIFKPNSDNYLKFLVTELKPFIDKHYSVYKDQKHTFIAGSSMGGLISMYAICEYPAVFGGAACMSTHWPGIFSVEDNPVPDAFVNYMRQHLPNPKTHKIYFDYGDHTLDAMYQPLQKKADVVMKDKGYKAKNWKTLFFPGKDHSEKSWQERLHIPLEFLIQK
jgi:enterochelin esterase-like enzyme